MTTKVPVELSSTPGIVDGSNATAITIDSSERVGIGESSPDELLVIGGDVKIKSTNKLHFTNTSDQTSIHAPASNTMAFTTNTTERMRIASTGNVSIGTTTVDRELKVQKSGDSAVIAAVSGTSNLAGMVMGDTSDDDRGAVLYNNSGDYLYFQANAVQYGQFNSTGEFHVTSGGNAIAPTIKHGGATGDVAKIRVINRSGQGADKGGVLELGAITDDGVSRSDVFASIAGLKDNATSGNKAGYMQFMTSNGSSLAEKMRLDSNGNFLVGTTETPITLLSDGHSGFGVSGNDDYMVSSRFNGASGYFKRENSNGSVLEFLRDASGVGSITVTTTSTSFNTTSDYRLKENVNYTWDATTRLKQLKPARFNFIADETNTLVDGFLAHEVSSIVPEAITGEKDGAEMQGIDQSKLVPLLVKTIQELEARITTLEGS